MLARRMTTSMHTSRIWQQQQMQPVQATAARSGCSKHSSLCQLLLTGALHNHCTMYDVPYLSVCFLSYHALLESRCSALSIQNDASAPALSHSLLEGCAHTKGGIQNKSPPCAFAMCAAGSWRQYHSPTSGTAPRPDHLGMMFDVLNITRCCQNAEHVSLGGSCRYADEYFGPAWRRLHTFAGAP